MTAPLNADPTTQATITGYTSRPVTKPPNWHGLVTLDLLFNNLSTGLFLATAVGELVAPGDFRPLAAWAYPVALLWLIGDLVCLVLDLGDPSRFHHMLRVWKPSSPMSLGTWVLTAYSLPLTALALVPWVPGLADLGRARPVMLVLGVLLAAGAAVYKGVLFSTTAQRGWGEARWLGGYLINSALALGAAELLLLATATGHGRAIHGLRLALGLLLALNLVALALLAADVRGPLLAARGARELARTGALAVVAGIVAPLALMTLDTPASAAATMVFMLVGATAVRSEIVGLPHRLAERSPA
jgi:Ni/Fe-hydrogenase subunit HybB-like protein